MSLTDAIRNLARHGQPLPWDAWFPIAQVSSHDPQQLLEAITDLTDEDQYAVLDQLKADSGPLADFLLITLANNPALLADEQVRAYVLEDSALALLRRQMVLAELAASVRECTDRMLEQRQSNFNTASEIASLEARRNTLMAEQLESGHHEMNTLEWEIARLETLRSRLQRYDAAERRSVRDQLQVEADGLQQDRNAVEAEVAEAIRARDAIHNDVESLRRQQHELDSEHSQLEAEQERLERVQQSRTVRADESRRALADREASIATVTQEVARLQEEMQRLEGSLRAEESRLEQLRTSPVAATATQLIDQIRELYRELPADDADRMFTRQ